MIHVEAQGQEEPNDPWLDMIFGITDWQVSETHVTFRCAEQSDLGEVGFRGHVPRFWKPFADAQGEVIEPLTSQTVSLSANGVRSANLTRYVNGWPVGFSEEEDDGMPPWSHDPGVLTFACVNLGQGEAIDLAKDYGRLKLFHEQAPYWESFFHIVPEAQQVAWNEKDQCYRARQRDMLLKIWE